MKRGILVISLMIFLLTASIAYSTAIKCFDDGSIKISGLTKRIPISAKLESSEDYFDVTGRYTEYGVEGIKTYNFYSDDALFVNQENAKYTIKRGKDSYALTCPPFSFSCRIINISIDYCYSRDGVFTSKFMAHNFHFDKTNVLRFTQPYMLKYVATNQDNRELVHSSNIISPEFKEVNFSLRKLNDGNKYILRWPTDQKIKKFVISYDDCKKKQYHFYESTLCQDEISCTIDKDCLDYETCQDNTCIQLDCQECNYPENHQCLNYDCCWDDQCDADETCVEHNCEKFECNDDEKIEENQCVKLECADDEYISNNDCVKLECPLGESALNHGCHKLECQWYEKLVEYECVNLIVYWFNRLNRVENNFLVKSNENST